MNNKVKTNIKQGVVNFFGTVGYFACALQWFWAVLLYFSLIEGFAKSITPTATEAHKIQPVVAAGSGSASTLQLLIVVVITIIMAVTTVYILLKMPSMIAGVSKKIVHDTADTIAPVVLQVQKKQPTGQNRLKLSAGIVVIIKAVLIGIPVILSLCSVFLEKQVITYYIVLIITFWLASASIVFFVIQYLVAFLFKIKKQQLW